jgi:2-keto-3-deoxy-L-rhamnonate aldolase RhmA
MVHATVSASQGSCIPVVRVPSRGVEWIKWALDSGADGVIIPMINNKEEMDLIIKRAIYPPGGARSNGLSELRSQTTTPQAPWQITWRRP